VVKRIGLVVNPTSGKNRGMALGLQVAHRLRAAGHEVLDLSDESYAAARDRALGAIAQGVDLLAVVGGDGMAHLGVNLAAETKTPLAIIAAGTGNDVARGLGLPVHDPVRAADVITTGAPRQVDAVRMVDAHGQRHWFIGVLGAGFDSVVTERANTWAWPKGQMRYNLAILRELPLFAPIPYVVTLDGVRHETRAMLVAVGNGRSYGGGMQVLPDAELDDGELDVLILHEIGTVEFLKVFPRVFKGTHVSHPAVEVLRGRQVTLEAEGIVAYADGERFGTLPLTLEVVPGAVTVMVPSAAAAPVAPSGSGAAS
jgi:diacylglycerol kinase (ATP)